MKREDNNPTTRAKEERGRREREKEKGLENKANRLFNFFLTFAEILHEFP